jgi:O-antigen ligase
MDNAARWLLPGTLLIGCALLLSQAVVSLRIEVVLGVAFVVAVFLFVFVKTEVGLFLVLFSMLLSPEFSVGAGALAEERTVILRLEDLLLIAIATSWFAKMAVNKELGLVVKTPLNRPILGYLVTTLLATLAGYVTGTVKTAAGLFYVMKYVEYFVVYYMTVNYLRERPQARRLVITAFATAVIVSLIGAAQIPGGQRVSAPFEGEVGEPNTFGGYLLLMMAIATGVALHTERFKTRVVALGALGLMAVPFLFTLSRASYLGAIPMAATFGVVSRRHRALVALIGLGLAVAVVALPSVLPAPVTRRVLYTFEPERGQATVKVGRVAFDPSTSERLLSMQQAIEGWAERPILGWGVTGFKFLDAQYARTLVETGIVGFAAFLVLVVAVLRAAYTTYQHVTDPEARGVALGFLAGSIGLLVHAVGANTFIIVRIMEPYWFFAGLVVVLPALTAERAPLGAAA